jgi:hypothetical protein
MQSMVQSMPIWIGHVAVTVNFVLMSFLYLCECMLSCRLAISSALHACRFNVQLAHEIQHSFRKRKGSAPSLMDAKAEELVCLISAFLVHPHVDSSI